MCPPLIPNIHVRLPWTCAATLDPRHDQSFNDKLTNDIFSFEQLGPDRYGGYSGFFFFIETYSTCYSMGAITKTRLYNFDPLKPHFYIVKLGFTWVYIIFLILLQNIDCGYSLEPPRRGGSNEYPQSML